MKKVTLKALLRSFIIEYVSDKNVKVADLVKVKGPKFGEPQVRILIKKMIEAGEISFVLDGAGKQTKFLKADITLPEEEKYSELWKQNVIQRIKYHELDKFKPGDKFLKYIFNGFVCSNRARGPILSFNSLDDIESFDVSSVKYQDLENDLGVNLTSTKTGHMYCHMIVPINGDGNSLNTKLIKQLEYWVG